MDTIINFLESVDKANKLKILTYNVRSIKSLYSFNKFKYDISGIVKHVDILILMETWIEENTKFDLYKLHNFNSINSSRNLINTEKKCGGGLLIYVHKNYQYEMLLRKSTSYCEIIIIKILVNTNPLIVIGVYRPPNTDFNEFIKDFECTIEIYSNNEVIICGDMNIDLLSHDSKTLQYKDLLKSYDISISNNAITRNASATIIDHILSFNLQTNILTLTATKTNLSDHNSLITIIDRDSVAKKSFSNKSIHKYDFNAMRLNFNINMDTFMECDVNNKTDMLLNKLRDCMARHSSTKLFKIKSNDLIPVWANERFFRLHKRIENIECKIYKLSKLNKPTSKLRDIQSKTKDLLKNYNEEMSRKHYENIIRNNPSNRWMVVNKILGKSKSPDNKLSLIHNGQLTDNEAQIVEILADCFESNTTTYNSSYKLQFLGPVRNNCIFFDIVSYEEIRSTIMMLNKNKSTGSDGIPTIILKELVNEIVIPLTELINQAIISSNYPDKFKYAHVIPLHKGGLKTSPENYRGISLLPILSKIMEDLILKRLNDFIKHNNLEDMTQYGYKKGIGTQDAIFKFTNEASMALDKNEYLIVLFVDLRKAFDLVNHDVLLYKLRMLGIKGITYELLKSYLEDRKFSVKYNNIVSLMRRIRTGVPQGAKVSPTLFNVNQIDLQYLELDAKTIKFADDLLVYKSCSKNNLEAGLDKMSSDLERINEYYKNNGLTINFNKTSFMILRNCINENVPEMIKLNGNEAIKRVQEQKYLGIIIDENLNFKSHHELLIKKLTDTLRALRIIRNYLPRKALIEFFNAHFLSHVYYCAFIYAKLTKDEIKRIQILENRCIKTIFKLDSRHATVDLYKSYMERTLPAIGIIYYTMIINIKKSLIFNSALFPSFELIESNTRSKGLLKSTRFNRKNRIGNEASNLGVRLFNQLPIELRQLKRIGKFKTLLKKYLLDKIDLLLDEQQLCNRLIS